MAQGKTFPPEVRAMTEALYRAGFPTRDVRGLLRRATGETPPDDSTLRYWRRRMKSGAPRDDKAVVFAELAARMTQEDLVRLLAGGIEVVSEAKERGLRGEDIIEFVALRLMARLLRLPRLDVLANSLVYQWGAHAKLRERLPKEDPGVHMALAYLWGIEREVGPEAVARAWALKNMEMLP